jgi:hypothetical protein
MSLKEWLRMTHCKFSRPLKALSPISSIESGKMTHFSKKSFMKQLSLMLLIPSLMITVELTSEQKSSIPSLLTWQLPFE